MNSAAKAAIGGGLVIVLLPVVVLAMFVGSEIPANAACQAAAANPAAVAGGGAEQLGPDGTPTIIGTAVLPANQLLSWYRDNPDWATTVGPGQVPVDEVLATYYLVGGQEGVRPDLAFIQAAHETGGFTNSDARQINNFAGVAHYDDLAISGTGWATAEGGVIGHVQLLKRYAQGNDVALAMPDQSVEAGATAATFGALAGTWATDPNYWSSLARLYNAAGGSVADTTLCPTPAAPQGASSSGPVTVDYVQGVPVNANVKPQVEAMVAAAAADGVDLRLGNSYRSIDRQIELRRKNCGPSNYAIYDMPSGQCRPPTATPGASQHQLGLAIDFSNCSTQSTACWKWLNTNAATYGYFPLASEPWHWSTTGR